MAKISSLLLEATTVNFKGQSFTLVLDTNEDPKKKGVKIQFVPAAFAQLSPQDRDDIAIALEQKLDTGLQKVGLKVERDRQLKDPNIIGFFIYIEYLDRIVRKVLQGAQ